MRWLIVVLVGLLAVQMAQAASNATGYRIFTDSRGEKILDMWNNNRSDCFDGECFPNPPVHYYIPAENWTKTTNILDESGDPVWKEQYDMGIGYLPSGESWNGTNMIAYWIRNFTNWDSGVATNNDTLTAAWVKGYRTIQGRTIEMKKINYLTNDSTTMLVNETWAVSGSTPVLFALYKHYDLAIPNPVWRAKLNGTWNDIPLGVGIKQLIRGEDIDLQDSIIGELLPSGGLGFQIRMRPMDGGRFRYWVYINDGEVFEAVQLGQFNGSDSLKTTRGWVDAFCSVTPGCIYSLCQMLLDGAASDIVKEVGNNVEMKCRMTTAAPCNPSGDLCILYWTRLNRTSLTPIADQEPLDFHPVYGAHFYQSCNVTDPFTDACEKGAPADNTYYAKNVGLHGNSTGMRSGGIAAYKTGFRYMCRYSTPFGTWVSITKHINSTDNGQPSLIQQYLPANNSFISNSNTVTHHLGTVGEGIWDNGYVRNVTFRLFNASGYNVANHTYNCSYPPSSTWDYVSYFSMHNCTLTNTDGFSELYYEYANWTLDFGAHLAAGDISGLVNNSQYFWDVNVSDNGGGGNDGLTKNWKLSNYNFTFCFGCRLTGLLGQLQLLQIEDDEDEPEKPDYLIPIGAGMMLVFFGLMMIKRKKNVTI